MKCGSVRNNAHNSNEPSHGNSQGHARTRRETCGEFAKQPAGTKTVRKMDSEMFSSFRSVYARGDEDRKSKFGFLLWRKSLGLFTKGIKKSGQSLDGAQLCVMCALTHRERPRHRYLCHTPGLVTGFLEV